MDTNNDQLRQERLKKLGLAIAHQRELKHLSQRQLASMLGYTNHSHLSRIESGKTAPSIEMLLDIADILEVEVYKLFIGI